MSLDNFQYRQIKQDNSKNIKEKFQEIIGKIKDKFSNNGGGPTGPNFRGPKKEVDVLRLLKLIGLAILALGAAGVIAMTLLIILVSFSLPNIHDLDKLSLAQSTTIYDREGNVMYVKHGDENRQYVPFEQISNNIINATIAIEDDQFWTHSGFDLVGIARAVFINVSSLDSKQQGGSTITQQYIKNTFLTSEKSYIRKLKELILAVQLEQTYDKKKIIELYLNKIPYGNNAFGVEKASQIYFKKKAKDLNLAEATILASLPKAPSHYNPYGQYKFSVLTKTFEPDDLKGRSVKSEADLKDNEFIRGLIGKEFKINDENSVYIQGRTDLVLRTMERLGYITSTEKEEALAKLQTIEFNQYVSSIKAPHFVFHVLSQLEKKYGKELVEQGGLHVYTSIDPKLQEAAEKAITEGVEKNKRFNAKNGALTAIDPKTGQVLAMVGSKDFFSKEIDGAVNVATQYRQPGSSFKPIVYAKAFYNRYAPGSIVFDVETRFGSSAYPKNFDGTFMGPMSIRKALGLSRNIPAIKAYFLAGEQKEIIELSERMGISFLDTQEDYGWPLALGTAEVRQLDLVSAFGVFANGGIRQEPVTILKIKNATGETLEEWKEKEGLEALDPQIAYLINDILADPAVKIGENVSVAGKTVAAKTGTSNRKVNNTYYPHDLWTIGYTPSLVVGVWTGNNDAKKEGNLATTASGYSASAPIWKQFMTEALKNQQDEKFPIPDGIRHETISKLTGKLPGPNTPASQLITDVFASFSVPTEIDDSYTEAKVDDRNKKLANDYCPTQYVKNQVYLSIHDIAPIPAWQEGAQRWMQSHMGEAIEGAILGAPPIVESELCSQINLASAPKIVITSLSENEKIETGSTLNVTISITAANGTEKAEFYLDDQFKYSSNTSPYTGIIRLPKAEVGTKKHIIKVVVFDNFGYSGEASVNIFTSKNTDDEKDDEKIILPIEPISIEFDLPPTI
jgi:penicillin-binding protein 1A